MPSIWSPFMVDCARAMEQSPVVESTTARVLFVTSVVLPSTWTLLPLSVGLAMMVPSDLYTKKYRVKATFFFGGQLVAIYRPPI